MPGPAGEETRTEAELRSRFGIPSDAARVVVFGESTHWDPNWLATSEGYWRWRVRRTLDRALEVLVADERRVFGIECIFFLRMYWERRPEHRDTIRDLVNSRRIQLTGSGVTTPDTLLPRTEAILRDHLVGQEWLRANGMTQEPRLAYFPDSFGHSPALPALLRALGCDRAAITRVDGMFFPGCDWEPPRRFPRPGSTAAVLTDAAADFVWRGPDGSSVLCHWNTYGYGMGELIAHRGITRVNGLPFAVPDRSETHVARRVDAYASRLQRVSPTPYLFCPIGYDFSAPLPALMDVLDRYNAVRYGDTGTWVVCAGLDDHLSLVDTRRDGLPVLGVDPNPYWTGFYTSRPSLKRACHGLVDDLLLAERLGVSEADPSVRSDLADAWYTACVSNHHDFVTGTSPDRVVAREQRPWLDRATATANRVLTRLALAAEPPHAGAPPAPPRWQRDGAGAITVQVAGGVVVTVDPAAGATVATHDPAGTRLLAPGSLRAVVWADEGGLWRMGHEFAGGRFDELAATGEGGVACEVAEDSGTLAVSTQHDSAGLSVRRTLLFRPDVAGVVCRTEATVGERRTATVALQVAPVPDLTMDCPGGQVRRPLRRHYRPTFWPLHRWARLGPVTLLSELPGAVAVAEDGRVDVVVGRNATHERAWGLLPIPGMPAPGREPGVQVCEIALVLDDAAAAAAWSSLWPRDPARRALAAAAATVSCDRDDVEVAAVKAADRGEGVIVRLFAAEPPGTVVWLRLAAGPILRARLCDARERDLDGGELDVRAGAVAVPVERAITSVRLEASTPWRQK